MRGPLTSIAAAAPRRVQRARAVDPAGRSLAAVLLTLLLGACAADQISDRRNGQQLVCHEGRKSVAVSNADSFVHLDHGDQPGPCPDGS